MGMACGVDHDRGRGDVAYSPIHFSSALHLLSSTTPSISFPSFRFVAVLLHFLSFLVISFPSRDASRAWVAAVPFIDRAPSFSPSLSRLFASRFTSLSAHSRSNSTFVRRQRELSRVQGSYVRVLLFLFVSLLPPFSSFLSPRFLPRFLSPIHAVRRAPYRSCAVPVARSHSAVSWHAGDSA